MTITVAGPDRPVQLQQIADLLAAAKKVVVLVGAGISTNSGIPVSHYPAVNQVWVPILIRISGLQMASTI